MGYQCYEMNGRDQGYGVPAKCDYPGCDEDIDRGMGFACGGDPQENCGRFFCHAHKRHDRGPEDGSGENHDYGVCERCTDDAAAPFEPSPDTEEWITHKMTCKTWAAWRAENPEFVKHHSVTP